MLGMESKEQCKKNEPGVMQHCSTIVFVPLGVRPLLIPDFHIHHATQDFAERRHSTNDGKLNEVSYITFLYVINL